MAFYRRMEQGLGFGLAGRFELGEVVPAHGDDTGRLTSSYRTLETSWVTPEREEVAMVGYKGEVASMSARCSMEWLASSGMMMASAAAHCSILTWLGCPPGIQGHRMDMAGGREKQVGAIWAWCHAIGGHGA